MAAVHRQYKAGNWDVVVVALGPTGRASTCICMITHVGHLCIGGLLQMGMVPPASPAPRYCSCPLPVLQQLGAVSWMPEPSLGPSPINRPWSWRDPKAGGLRLPWHGHSCSVDTVSGRGPAACSFVGARLLATIVVCVGEVAARCWGLGRRGEEALLGGLASALGRHVPESLFSSSPFHSASVCPGHVCELSMEGG